jgi:histidinol-phosphatase
MSPRLAFALNAVHEAGKTTLAYFDTPLDVELKEDDSPVTAADKHAERVMREAIRRQYPREAILGEEEGGPDDLTRWIIDPIDGTKSFISGVPLYGTLLSFEMGGRPTLGIAYFPALDEMVYAEEGGGAFRNGRACKVSGKSGVKGAVLSSGSHYSMKEYGRSDPFQKLAERAMATRTWSDAYGHALVATGRIEAMIDPVVKRWDISAMSIIVREAGGAFSDFDGNEELADEAISSNGLVHEELLEAFSR